MPNNLSLYPIIQIEDDPDDQFLVQKALTDLDVHNPVRFFNNGQQALDYLLITKEKPLVILCDINMPTMNGLELRDQIDNNPYLKEKAVPFVFFTTSANADLVRKAYAGNIQGFYQKEVGYEALKQQLNSIILYWKNCLHPNSFQEY